MTTQKRLVLASATLSLSLAAGVALAQENITFPIEELGGCASKEACRTYCDSVANAESCASFAETHGLVSAEEAEQIRTFAGQAGPGGCEGSECRAYCADSAHRDECIAFARAHGLTVPPSRAEIESRTESETEFEPDIDEPSIDEERAMQIVETQGGPGGCRTMEECQTFCDAEGNMEICFAFAVEHKLMSQGEIERARAMMSQTGPGGCRGLECRTYCENPEHADACLAFAEEQGFMEPEEAEKARKLMNTTGPGGCRGMECQRYCEDANHQEECLDFALQQGFISAEEAGSVRQFMEHGGPGGCRTPEECERFCLRHPEECGVMLPDVNQNEMHERIENFTGPGGCEGPDECTRYCTEHPDACGRSVDIMMEEKYELQGDQLPYHPPEYEPPDTPADYQHQFDEQYNEQYREQYQQQYEEQFREGYEQQYETEWQEHTDYTEPSSEPVPEPTSVFPFSSLAAAVYFVVSTLLGM